MVIQLLGIESSLKKQLLSLLLHLVPQSSIRIIYQYSPHSLPNIPSLLIISYQTCLTKAAILFKRDTQPQVGSEKVIPICMVVDCPSQRALAEVLRLGAQDGILRPFHPDLFLFRIKKLMFMIPKDWQSLKTPHFWLDANTFQIGANQHVLQLRPKEFQLLTYLIRFKKHTLTRTQLLNFIWSKHHAIQENTIDSHIKEIRRKLEILQVPSKIYTVYGRGYRFEEC